MRSSTARWIRSQIPRPYGLITIVPRASEGSARPPCFTTSWYQPGKSSDCFGSAIRGSVTAGRGPVAALRRAREDRVQLLKRSCGFETTLRSGFAADLHDRLRLRRHPNDVRRASFGALRAQLVRQLLRLARKLFDDVR